MKQYIAIVGVAVALTACGGEQQEAAMPEAKKPEVAVIDPEAKTVVVTGSFDKKALSEEAKTAVQTLGGTLKSELQQAIKSGGPVNALTVCNTRAPEIADSVSIDKNLQVSRVSLKNRNPKMGKANTWQVKVLEDFETRKANGEQPMTLAYSEVVEHNGRAEFRFMKAIPTGQLCLTCHGTEIRPAVQAKLTELYPDDKATGYKEGDLRGAFVVVKSLQ